MLCLHPAGAVVGQDAGGGVLDVAALPGLVRHPEILDHFRLAGVIFLKNIAVEEAFLRKRLCEAVFFAALGEGLIGIEALGVFLQIVDHRMADGVGEGRLLPPEDIVGEDMIIGKGLAQEVLAHVVGVHFELRADGHDVLDEIQIAEGNSGLEGVDGDAAVGAQHVIHMQLADTLGRLLLKCRRARREVRILVAEELVGDLAREQPTQIGLLMDGLADEVHADARADGRDVICAEQRHDLRQRLNHILARDDNLGVVGVQILRHLAGVFQVDGIAAHTDGKRADGLFEQLCRDRAHKAAVQSAGDADDGGLGVRVGNALGQPVGLHGEDELAALGAGGIVGRDERRRRDGPRERHLPQRQVEHDRLVSRALGLERRAAAALADHASEVELRMKD